MPLYEYFCENCDAIFEALKSLRDSEQPVPCRTCWRPADRIMPTTFASMSVQQGWAQRVPFHHRSVRAEAPKRTIARVKPKAGKPARATGGTGKAGGRKD